MGKTEIIAELGRLGPEDLADVKAWLDRRTLSENISTRVRTAAAASIPSPRLADSARAADFVKQVIGLSHASL